MFRILGLAVTLAAILTSDVAADELHPLSLAEAVRIAIANDAELYVARIDAEVAASNVDLASSVFAPHLFGSVYGTHDNQAPTARTFEVLDKLLAGEIGLGGEIQTGATYNAGLAGWAVQDDQRSHVLAGYYTWGGLRVGLAWNTSRTTSPATGLVTGDRQSWVVPASYTTGPHTFAAAYTRANDSKDVTATTGTAAARGVDYTVSGANTGANMWTVGYGYDLSKRTALGLSYGRLQNKSAANYGFFYNAQTAFGSANGTANPGETHSLFSATIRHNF